MAKSQYEYVKQFELADTLLPQCWIVCRIDGVGFTKFTAAHHLEKPNDRRAMDLMNTAAKAVMTTYPDICISIGMSDEYSFVLHPGSVLYNRRASKITTAIVSLFTSSFVFHWGRFFPSSPLQVNNLPFFDGRVVCYPTDALLKDYLRWRQVDAHINNLYNTTFWMLVRAHQASSVDASGAPLSEKDARERAHKEMNTTYASSAAKHELLHERFGVNYNDEPEEFRKGNILVWDEESVVAAGSDGGNNSTVAESAAAAESQDAAASSASAASAAASSSASPSAASPASPAAPGVVRSRRVVRLIHCDLIQESFYTDAWPGIVPYVSPAQQRKDLKAADKAAKKAAHKSREKEEKKMKHATAAKDVAATTTASDAATSSAAAATSSAT